LLSFRFFFFLLLSLPSSLNLDLFPSKMNRATPRLRSAASPTWPAASSTRTA
jgi:hypothetical protein